MHNFYVWDERWRGDVVSNVGVCSGASYNEVLPCGSDMGVNDVPWIPVLMVSDDLGISMVAPCHIICVDAGLWSKLVMCDCCCIQYAVRLDPLCFWSSRKPWPRDMILHHLLNDCELWKE